MRHFAITTTTHHLRLDDKGKGKCSFTVTNASVQPVRGRTQVRPQGQTQAEWLELEGEAERSYPAGGTHQFTVRVAPPLGTSAGRYGFKLMVVNVDKPDEDFTEGPEVAFEAPHSEGPPPRRFPWWVLTLSAGVIVFLLALVVGLARRDNTPASQLGVVVVKCDPAIVQAHQHSQCTASATDQYGQPFAVSDYAWSSNNEDVAKVDSTGKITTFNAGSILLTARVTAGGITRQGEATLAVAEPVIQLPRLSAVAVKCDPDTVQASQSSQCTASATDQYGQPFAVSHYTWSSSNERVAKVGPTGKATTFTSGSTTLSARVTAGGITQQGETTLAVTGPVTPEASIRLKLDGATQYVDIPGSDVLDFHGPVTVEAWVRPSDFNELRNIVTHGDGGFEFFLRINRAHYEVGFWDGHDYNVLSPVPAGDLNNWVHLAGVYAGGTQSRLVGGGIPYHEQGEWRLYRNGKLVASNKSPFGIRPIEGKPWTIGALGKAPPLRFFKGEVRDVRVWKRARSEEEIQKTMNDPPKGDEPDLVGYWPLDEGRGSIVHGRTAGEQHGLLRNSPTWQGPGAGR